MTNEEITIKITDHTNEIGSLKHRVCDLEKQTDMIQKLVMSVNELALNMKNMLDEIKDQGDRLKKLENEPIEKWNTAKKTAFTTAVSTVSGGIVVMVIMLLARYFGGTL